MAASPTPTRKRRLVWHRRDLRLRDNELYDNLNADDECISLFVFDDHYFRPQPSLIKPYETVWCGPHGAQSLIEAVQGLRQSLRQIGGDLLIRCGDPADMIPMIAEQMGATEISFGQEPGTYESGLVQQLVQHYAFDESVRLIGTVGYTLYHPEDLPAQPDRWDQLAHPKQNRKKKGTRSQPNRPTRDGYEFHRIVNVRPERFRGICRIMGDFRKVARSSCTIRQEIATPTKIRLPPDYELDDTPIPTLFDLTKAVTGRSILGLPPDVVEELVQSVHNRCERPPRNEKVALTRLGIFSQEAGAADRSRVDVSNGDSSRFSVHLALGTLSPRTISWLVADREDCQWLVSHLEMRDFFLYTAWANGARLFSSRGVPRSNNPRRQQGPTIDWKSPEENQDTWTRWATGQTQLPLVDAGMRELMRTGYCSNRVRQNVASVLTKDLNIDWRAGAEWFQFLLEDHCVGANYGNWLYFSGVGPDPKNRHFRTVSQMKRYDNGSYAPKWIPKLRDLGNPEAVLRPWDFGVHGFSNPVVDPRTQYTWNDLHLLDSTGSLLEEES